MEEELNEHELEERLYAMLHHVDDIQNNVTETTQKRNDANSLVENAPQGTMRRYWRIGAEYNPIQKINTVKDQASPFNKPVQPQENTTNVPKEEKTSPPPSEIVDLSLIQSPVSTSSKLIEIDESENVNTVSLESSDEDEVVEVALPPKPTITIESSDEDDLQIVKPNLPAKTPKPDCKNTSKERSKSASPVPSVVSSVSDDFIRGDCIALNITSRKQDNPSFDFSLHGSDLIVHETPTKKKKKKKSREVLTSTPVVESAGNTVNSDECFATPKSKAKNRKQANNVRNTPATPNIDIYDSDSNQSLVDTSKSKNMYMVTDRSLPSVDVYESDSSHSEVAKDSTHKTNDADSSDSSTSNTPNIIKRIDIQKLNSFIDLTENDSYNNSISENIVMGNVTGFETEYADENQAPTSNSGISKYVSSKVPSILNEDLDFDNLKGKDTVCKNRKYSLTTLRAEMEKFYNESWGGEDFNHREIQKYMSRDKSLWAIDPKDRMPSIAQRKVICNYCNRPGHRDEHCRWKPPVCYMCGTMGHIQTRCPDKICVNCGSPNNMYTNMCRKCASWGGVRCEECGQMGHPASHCPDIWRRYHNTIDINKPLEKCFQNKKYHELYCSGCARRGHLIHMCRTTIPFSGLPINSPYIFNYRAIFTTPKNNKFNKHEDFTTHKKRQSKSPTAHETHLNKKRNTSATEDDSRGTNVAHKNTSDDANKRKLSRSLDSSTNVEKAADFIPIGSSNHDNKGQVIQDNEVSDTSDIVTSARIYVTDDVIDMLKSKEGKEWLAATCNKLNVTIQNSEITSFLNIRGKLAQQEAFQTELREWNKSNNKKDTTTNNNSKINDEDTRLVQNLPKNKKHLLDILSKALDSLKEDMGDPKSFFNELTYSQNRHEKLLKQKIIRPQTLNNSRTHINDVATRLNTVLLGQAGLADGMRHVHQLYALKDKVSNIQFKNVPLNVRKEIGEHYQNIFGPNIRNDYSELLKKYYLGNSVTPLKKRKKKKKELNPVNNALAKNTNSIPPQADNMNDSTEVNNQKAGSAIVALTRKLVFFHKRLQRLHVEGKMRKKSKVELIKKLHSLIAYFFKKENVTNRLLKKARKAQAEAQQFLTNV